MRTLLYRALLAFLWPLILVRLLAELLLLWAAGDAWRGKAD